MRHILWAGIMIAAALAWAGCGTEPTGAPVASADLDAPKAGDITQELLDSLVYEEFGGLLVPGEGAWLMASMTTWPKSCTFALNIPPQALPPSVTEPTEFTMRIPAMVSYKDHPQLPLIIRLEPSGIDFQVPIMVLATLLPWGNAEAGDIVPYGYLEDGFNQIAEATAAADPATKRLRITMVLPHFSDWASPEDGGVVPNGAGF